MYWRSWSWAERKTFVASCEGKRCPSSTDQYDTHPWIDGLGKWEQGSCPVSFLPSTPPGIIRHQGWEQGGGEKKKRRFLGLSFLCCPKFVLNHNALVPFANLLLRGLWFPSKKASLPRQYLFWWPLKLWLAHAQTVPPVSGMARAIMRARATCNRKLVRTSCLYAKKEWLVFKWGCV